MSEKNDAAKLAAEEKAKADAEKKKAEAEAKAKAEAEAKAKAEAEAKAKKPKKVRVICDGTLGPKLLQKGEVTDNPEYVALLEVKGQKKVEEVK